MNSASGIGATQELIDSFANADRQANVRVIKVSIANEALVQSGSWPRNGDLTSDFESIPSYVEDNVPAYLLVRLDSSASEWLAISYVPDTAKIRDKMLYASTRNAVTKALGASKFTDSIFATSKADITPEAYAAHLQHMSAPKPLSAREAELADLRAAEKAAGTSYQGSGVRMSHVGNAGLGLGLTDEVKDALQQAAESGESTAVLMSVDTQTESLVLEETRSRITPEQLASFVPTSHPSYTFYSWPHQHNGESITSNVFIYCCPSGSLVKHRMLYSAGVQPLAHTIKTKGIKLDKKSETSDPQEINAAWLMQELSHAESGTSTPAFGERVAFAKPKGPPRRR